MLRYYSRTKTQLKSQRCIKNYLKIIQNWFQVNSLLINASKTKYVIFHNKKGNISEDWDLSIGEECLKRENLVKFLGVIIDEKLTWRDHIDKVISKVSKSLALMRGMKNVLNQEDLKTMYYSFIYPHLTYAVEVWGHAKKGILARIEKLQKKFVCCVSKAHYLDHTLQLFKKLHILKINDLSELLILKQMHMYNKNCVPVPISELFTRNERIHQYNTRRRSNPQVYKCKTAIAKKGFVYLGTHLWFTTYRDFETIQETKTFVKKYSETCL